MFIYKRLENILKAMYIRGVQDRGYYRISNRLENILKAMYIRGVQDSGYYRILNRIEAIIEYKIECQIEYRLL